jgi:hypothetical protein
MSIMAGICKELTRQQDSPSSETIQCDSLHISRDSYVALPTHSEASVVWCGGIWFETRRNTCCDDFVGFLRPSK